MYSDLAATSDILPIQFSLVLGQSATPLHLYMFAPAGNQDRFPVAHYMDLVLRNIIKFPYFQP